MTIQEAVAKLSPEQIYQANEYLAEIEKLLFDAFGWDDQPEHWVVVGLRLVRDAVKKRLG